jgi:hypothetical protein
MQAHQAKLHQCVSQQGGPLVQALLVALCETCPRSSMRPLAMLLHGLLTGPLWQAAARGWLAEALQSAELQGAQCASKLCFQRVACAHQNSQLTGLLLLHVSTLSAGYPEL